MVGQQNRLFKGQYLDYIDHEVKLFQVAYIDLFNLSLFILFIQNLPNTSMNNFLSIFKTYSQFFLILYIVYYFSTTFKHILTPQVHKLMTEFHKHYLKIAIIRAQIAKHVQFSKLKLKFPNLYFVINAQIVPNTNNTNVKIPPIQSLKIKETNQSQDYVFSQLGLKWDCINLEQKYLAQKLQLKLYFSIVKANQKISKSSKDFVKMLLQNQVDKSNYQVDFPINLPPFSVSLENFLKEPYKLHVINLDFKIPQESKLNPRGSGERDGMVTLELSFLQDLRAELEIRNAKLITKEFSKFYKVGMFQVLRNRRDFKRNKIMDAQKSLTQKKYIQTHHLNKKIQDLYQQKNIESGCLDLILEAHGWQQFRNNQSYTKPHIIPLELLNEEDEIAVLFQYQSVSENAGKNLTSGIFQSFANGNAKKNDKEWKNNLLQTTSESLIKINDLFQTKTGPNQWSTFVINIRNGHQEFDLEFQFMIKLEKGYYQQNLPKSLYKPAKKLLKQTSQLIDLDNTVLMLESKKGTKNSLKNFEMLTGSQEIEKKDSDKELNSNFAFAFLSVINE